MLQPKTIFIAIDGHGGSGKSSLASELAAHLQATVIHIDDFTGLGASDDWYKKIIAQVIDPILQGASSLSYAPAKWWPEHHPKPVINQPTAPVVIIEGVGSLRRELRDYMSLKLFVDTPRPVCVQRGLKRDRGLGGKSDVEILAMWNQWLDWDDQYFAHDDPEAVADLKIDGTNTFSAALKIITTKLTYRP